MTILDELAAALKRERRQGNADNWNEVRKAYFNIETAVERENAVHAIMSQGMWKNGSHFLGDEKLFMFPRWAKKLGRLS